MEAYYQAQMTNDEYVLVFKGEEEVQQLDSSRCLTLYELHRSIQTLKDEGKIDEEAATQLFRQAAALGRMPNLRAALSGYAGEGVQRAYNYACRLSKAETAGTLSPFELETARTLLAKCNAVVENGQMCLVMSTYWRAYDEPGDPENEKTARTKWKSHYEAHRAAYNAMRDQVRRIEEDDLSATQF